MEQIGQLFRDYGVLGVLAVALWRAGVFLAPHVKSLTESHMALIKTLRRTLRSQAEHQSQQTALLTAQQAMLQEIHGAVVRRGGEPDEGPSTDHD